MSIITHILIFLFGISIGLYVATKIYSKMFNDIKKELESLKQPNEQLKQKK